MKSKKKGSVSQYGTENQKIRNIFNHLIKRKITFLKNGLENKNKKLKTELRKLEMCKTTA